MFLPVVLYYEGVKLALALVLAWLLAVLGMAQTSLGVNTVSETGMPTWWATPRIVPYANGYYAATSNGDLVVQRYGTSGNLISTATWDNPQGGTDEVADAGMDTAGNLYVVVLAKSNLGGRAAWYLKFNASLALQFVRRVDDASSVRLLVTPGGFGIVVRMAFDGGSPVIRLVGFAANGNQIWTSTQPGTYVDAVLGLDNTVWVVGRTTTSLAMVRRFNGTTGVAGTGWTDAFSVGQTGLEAAAIDPNGTFYAIGTTSPDGTAMRATLVRFTNVFQTFTIAEGYHAFSRMRIDATHIFTHGTSSVRRIVKANPSVSSTTVYNAAMFRTLNGLEIDPNGDRVYVYEFESHGSVRLLRQFNKALTLQSSQNLANTLRPGSLFRYCTEGAVLMSGLQLDSHMARIQRINSDGTFGFNNLIDDTTPSYFNVKDVTGIPGVDQVVCGVAARTNTHGFVHRILYGGGISWKTYLPNFQPIKAAVSEQRVFVVGIGYQTFNGVNRGMVYALDRFTGATLWTKDMGTALQPGGQVRSLDVQGEDVVVGGSLAGETGPTTNFTARLNGITGSETWRFNHPSDLPFPGSIGVDTDGRVFVGTVWGKVFQLNSNGTLGWVATLNTGTTVMKHRKSAPQLIVANDGTASNAVEFRRINKSNGLMTAPVVRASYLNEDPQLDMSADGSTWGFMYDSNGQLLVETVQGTTSLGVATMSFVDDYRFALDDFGQATVYRERVAFDSEGGGTVGTEFVRYRPNMTQEFNVVVWSQTAGLDSRAAGLFHMGSGRFMTVRELEKRNDGVNVVYQRFKTEMAPVATANAYSVVRNQTLTVTAPGVLGNDSDPNGDTITAQLVTNPAAGTLTLNANGSLTYVAPSTTGTRSFTYRVVDSTGRVSNTVTVTLNVTN